MRSAQALVLASQLSWYHGRYGGGRWSARGLGCVLLCVHGGGTRGWAVSVRQLPSVSLDCPSSLPGANAPSPTPTVSALAGDHACPWHLKPILLLLLELVVEVMVLLLLPRPGT